MKKVKFILFLSFLSFIISSKAQEAGYVRKETPRSALYDIRVHTGIVSGGDYETEGSDALVGAGSTSNASVTQIDFSVPILTLKRGTVSLGAYYNYMHQEFEPLYGVGAAEYVHFDNNYHTWGAKAAYSFRTTLWGKMLFGFANIRMECSQYGLERISGFAAAGLLIKRKENSSLTVGAALLLNSSSKWPLFPFITYWYRFNEKWQLNIMMPQCHFTYNISRSDKLSLGSTIAGEHFYIRPHHSDLPSRCMYSRSYIRPEFVYEHSFTPLMRCSLRCGSIVYLNGKFTSHRGNSKYGEIDHDAAAFLQLSFSYGLKPF